jgi:hypothetical protein
MEGQRTIWRGREGEGHGVMKEGHMRGTIRAGHELYRALSRCETTGVLRDGA